METLQAVVNKLKVDFTEKVENDYISDNYGIKLCKNSGFKDFDFKKLEIIFLDNLCYLDLKENQLNKILIGNYDSLVQLNINIVNEFTDIDLVAPVIVNNTFVTNNFITNNILEDYWDQTDF